MKEALKSEIFRSKVKNFIRANIRVDLDGADHEGVLQMPCHAALSYSCLIDLRELEYKENTKEAELRLAKMVQYHIYNKDTCLNSKKGIIQCKCRAPFDLSSQDYINENGEWGPKCSYIYINSWCPLIIQCIHANQNIKLITSGSETINISFYISLYIIKRQVNLSNASVLLAKKLAFHRKHKRYNSDISRLNKRLLQQCANTLTREQEFSAPEVISYLMGYGNHFISHNFVTIYWSAVSSLLKRKYPQMQMKK
jgi:hypothetical protein